MEYFALDTWRTPWAVCPDAVPTISRLMTGDLARRIEAALPRVRAEATSERRSGGTVAVIPLRGVITPRASLLSLLTGGGGLQEFRSQLREAVASEDVDKILLDIDSPGGSTALLTETAAEIRAAREVKPIVAIANTMAASAAYQLGSQANEMIVTPSGFVGSIGTYVVHEDFSGLNEKLGVQVTYISAGKYKVEGNPDEPLTDEAREYAQSVVDTHYGDFLSDVAEGRGTSAEEVRDGYGEGRVLTAQNALDAGMVDRVESYEHTLVRMTSAEAAEPAPALIGKELQRTPSAEGKQADNEPPNAPQVAEEEARRISRLQAEHPIHVP